MENAFIRANREVEGVEAVANEANDDNKLVRTSACGAEPGASLHVTADVTHATDLAQPWP